MKYGYVRISKKNMVSDRQHEELGKYNLDRIYEDKQTGSNFDRPNYIKLRDEILREGDELYIKEVDRLGRNKTQTLEELKVLKDKGVIIRILEIPTTLSAEADGTPQNRLMLEMMNNMLIEMYTTFAQLELEKIKSRTKEALKVKKDNGDVLGRPKTERPKEFEKIYKQWKNKDITAVQAMKLLELKKTKFYEFVREYEGKVPRVREKKEA